MKTSFPWLGTIVIVTTALSCSSSSSAPPCDAMSESQCIDSSECTLVLASPQPPDYTCVAARNACEQGFVQRTGDATSCEATQGCKFVPGECYCPPDLVCVCGGGPPPQCEPAGP